eukprot:Tamp_06994.p1 GENE.Tamp_06994~~Tamp_06994.p1  ORF type:complete len:450 (-),score=58.82 Tamp_06994:1244-2521(-)
MSSLLGTGRKKKHRASSLNAAISQQHQVAGDRAGQICVDYINDKHEYFEKIRLGFQACSGYHTLQEELEWIQRMDEEKAWATQAFGPFTFVKMLLFPGSTKQMMMCALWAGVERHRAAFIAFMNLAATIAALFLSSTVALILTPPEYIVNPYDPSPFLVTENPDHFLWFTRAYMYCLYASAGASFALVVVSNYAAAWDLAVIRDADWIRIMSRHGDNVLWWQVWFLAITLGGIILTCCINVYMVYWNNISGWEERIAEENPSNPGTKPTMDHVTPGIFFILIGTLLNTLVVTLADAKGNVVNYYLNSPEGDVPDFDLLVAEFKERIEVSKQLRDIDNGAGPTTDVTLTNPSAPVIMPMHGFVSHQGQYGFPAGQLYPVAGSSFGAGEVEAAAVKQRLAACKILLDEGMITEPEYERQRSTILDSI